MIEFVLILFLTTGRIEIVLPEGTEQWRCEEIGRRSVGQAGIAKFQCVQRRVK